MTTTYGRSGKPLSVDWRDLLGAPATSVAPAPDDRPAGANGTARPRPLASVAAGRTNGHASAGTPAAEYAALLAGLESASALMAREFEPLRPLVPGLLYPGLTLLSGRPKSGKSILALSCALAAAAGGRFLGREVAQGGALFLALEDGARRLQGRIEQVMAGQAVPGGLTLGYEWPRLGGTNANALTAFGLFLDANPATRLIVIDTVTRLRPFRDVQRDTSYLADYSFLSPLNDLAHERDIAIVAVHHNRKAGSDTDPVDTVSGTTGLTGATDHIWILDRNRLAGDGSAVLHVVTRDDVDQRLDLRLRSDPLGWTCAGQAVEPVRTAERARVLEYVARAAGQVTTGEVASGLGITTNAASFHLRMLAKEGRIANPAYGHYIR